MSGWKGAGMDAGAGSLCKRLAFTGSTAVEKMVQTRHSFDKRGMLYLSISLQK